MTLLLDMTIISHPVKISNRAPDKGIEDGWMETCTFTSFSTVFQSYQEDEQLIMKGLCNGNPV